MSQKRKVLIALAVIGWTGTLLSHIIAHSTDAPEGKRDWEERRNQFLLLSSLTTNTLAFSTVYRYGKKIWERPKRETNQI